MGTSKFLPIKQLISNSTLNLLKTCSTPKPHINSPSQIARNYTTKATGYFDKSSLHYKTVQLLASSPNTRLTPFLNQYVEQGNVVEPNELKKIIQTLRRKKLSDRALEVSQWMTGNSLGPPPACDLAVQLDLIGQVHGIDTAERFFNKLDNHSEKMYEALLSCYVRGNFVDKALPLFQKMKDMRLPLIPLTYNNIMSLCSKIGQVDKVPELLSEMVENGIYPDHVTYKICLKSFALKSDFTSMEQVVVKMESLPHLKMNWSMYATVANYFLEGGFRGKAMHYLEKAANLLRDDAVGYNYLITLYTKLGDLSQVMSLWQKRRAKCKPPINIDYITVIGSLAKLDKFQEAERLLQEWWLSGNLFDFKVPHVLLFGYTKKGLVERAERLLESIIDKGKTPVPNSWSIISAGHIKCQNMDMALQYMMKALELGLQHQGWVPNADVVSSILNWLRDSRETEREDKFLKLLRRVVPEDHGMYQTLLTGAVRHENEIDGDSDSFLGDTKLHEQSLIPARNLSVYEF